MTVAADQILTLLPMLHTSLTTDGVLANPNHTSPSPITQTPITLMMKMDAALPRAGWQSSLVIQQSHFNGASLGLCLNTSAS